LVLALGGVGIGRFYNLVIEGLDPPDYATYYAASRLLENSPHSIYDPAALRSVISPDGPEQVFLYIYPPFVAGLLRPITRLHYHQSVTIWLVLNSLCLLGGFVGILALIRWPAGRIGAAVGLVLLCLFTPAQEALTLGQVSPILLLASVLALMLIERSRSALAEWAGGLLLGVATLIKIFPAILVFHALLRGRWRVVLGSIVGGLVCILIGLHLGGGWINTWTYFTDVLPSRYTGSFVFVHLGNQSLTGSFLRPLGDGALPRTLGLAAVLIVLAVTWIAPFVGRLNRYRIEFAFISMLPLLALSAVYAHLYVLILLPMAFLFELWYNGARQLITPLLFAYLLLIVNSYSEWLGLSVATWVPFGLIGTLTIWVLLLMQVSQRHARPGLDPMRSEE
jgi:hypothetical protein